MIIIILVHKKIKKKTNNIKCKKKKVINKKMIIEKLKISFKNGKKLKDKLLYEKKKKGKFN